MKLKESTFAIIAEKKDSISHKWFVENTKCYSEWIYLGYYYVYSNGNKLDIFPETPKNMPIYTESEFEAILKAEQENEAKETRLSGEELVRQGSRLTKEQRTENPKQITISYNLALEYIADRLNVDKGIIKIEMP